VVTYLVICNSKNCLKSCKINHLSRKRRGLRKMYLELTLEKQLNCAVWVHSSFMICTFEILFRLSQQRRWDKRDTQQAHRRYLRHTQCTWNDGTMSTGNQTRDKYSGWDCPAGYWCDICSQGSKFLEMRSVSVKFQYHFSRPCNPILYARFKDFLFTQDAKDIESFNFSHVKLFCSCQVPELFCWCMSVKGYSTLHVKI
jgi:hypothetical protein